MSAVSETGAVGGKKMTIEQFFAVEKKLKEKLENGEIDRDEFNDSYDRLKCLYEQSENGSKRELKYKTNISSEIQNKILEGKRKSPIKNEVIGGHSSNINNENPNFAVEVLTENPNGTKNVMFTKDLSDGNISKLKKSTLFPDSWSESKIIDSVKKVGDSPSISTRIRDGTTWHRQIIDGVEIDVLKIGNDVISAYPTGRINASKPSGF